MHPPIDRAKPVRGHPSGGAVIQPAKNDRQKGDQNETQPREWARQQQPHQSPRCAAVRSGFRFSLHEFVTLGSDQRRAMQQSHLSRHRAQWLGSIPRPIAPQPRRANARPLPRRARRFEWHSNVQGSCDQKGLERHHGFVAPPIVRPADPLIP